MGRPLLSGVRTELRCCPAGPAARSARTFRHEGAWIPSCFRTRTDCAQVRAPRVMVKTRARQSGTRFCSSPFGDLALRSLHSQHRQCTPSGVAGHCVKMALRFGIAIPLRTGAGGERRLGYTRIGRRQTATACAALPQHITGARLAAQSIPRRYLDRGGDRREGSSRTESIRYSTLPPAGTTHARGRQH
jgi:hypothetical protein